MPRTPIPSTLRQPNDSDRHRRTPGTDRCPKVRGMSWQSGRRVLVLGGIRSGKSELGEDLVTGYRAVRYVATGGAGTGDEEWTARVAAHRDRRPSWWDTEEIGTEPNRLATLLAEAKPDEALLVDDLGTWLTAMLDAGGGWDENAPAGDPDPAALAAAVRDCPAGLLVLVSPEVGLSVVPASAAGRTFADLIGTLNRALADACDTAVLVVAGQPTWLKGTDPRATTPASTTPVSTSAPADT